MYDPLPYTEEDALWVQSVWDAHDWEAAMLPEGGFAWRCSCGESGPPVDNHLIAVGRGVLHTNHALLAALAKAGRLLPAGCERHEEWAVIDPANNRYKMSRPETDELIAEAPHAWTRQRRVTHIGPWSTVEETHA